MYLFLDSSAKDTLQTQTFDRSRRARTKNLGTLTSFSLFYSSFSYYLCGKVSVVAKPEVVTKQAAPVGVRRRDIIALGNGPWRLFSPAVVTPPEEYQAQKRND